LPSYLSRYQLFLLCSNLPAIQQVLRHLIVDTPLLFPLLVLPACFIMSSQNPAPTNPLAGVKIRNAVVALGKGKSKIDSFKVTDQRQIDPKMDYNVENTVYYNTGLELGKFEVNGYEASQSVEQTVPQAQQQQESKSNSLNTDSAAVSSPNPKTVPKQKGVYLSEEQWEPTIEGDFVFEVLGSELPTNKQLISSRCTKLKRLLDGDTKGCTRMEIVGFELEVVQYALDYLKNENAPNEGMEMYADQLFELADKVS